MSNECVKDETIKILLDRREELRVRVNKDMMEYKAIGDIIIRLKNAEENTKKKDDRDFFDL